MHLHILGISGTFMSGLALLAKSAGYKVTGSDANCYPPISDLLAANNITWVEGYEDAELALKADLIIVGNAIKRGMPVLEAVLNSNKAYTSGPQWLAEHILSRYRVMAIAGTHGKTTTTSMLAHILEFNGLKPGFLIGGVAPNFNTSNCFGRGEWFVIEADEYDSAYFDKRPKLMHYRPEVAILNNLEFDHADIYENLSAIQLQFHYYLKTIPQKGIVIKPRDDNALNEVVVRGLYSRLEEIALTGDAAWRAEILNENNNSFRVWHYGKQVAEVNWSLLGKFNVENGLAAIAASFQAGVAPVDAIKALEKFKPVKRRLEVRGESHGITVYDDFAHHPTAVKKTIEALKNSHRHQRIVVVMEFASYTMKTGVHVHEIGEALQQADQVYLLKPDLFELDMNCNWLYLPKILPSVEKIIDQVTRDCKEGDAILIMSNRGFANIHQRLIEAINHFFSKELI